MPLRLPCRNLANDSDHTGNRHGSHTRAARRLRRAPVAPGRTGVTLLHHLRQGLGTIVRKDIDRATTDLCAWTEREEWMVRHLDVLSAHLSPMVDLTGMPPADALPRLPAEIVEHAMVFILEDFFTVRFGTDGKLNVVDAFLRRRGRRQSATARIYLKGLRDSAVSLYEVVGIDRGRSMTVRDLLRGGEPVTVEEKLGSTGVALHGHLAARLVAVGDTHLFTGVVLPFRREASLKLQSAFEEMAAELEPTIRGNTVTERTAEEMRALARQASVHTPVFPPVVIQFWLADAVAGSAPP